MAAVGRFRRRVSSGSDPCDLRISSDGRYTFNPVEAKALRHAVSCRVGRCTYTITTTQRSTRPRRSSQTEVTDRRTTAADRYPAFRACAQYEKQNGLRTYRSAESTYPLFATPWYGSTEAGVDQSTLDQEPADNAMEPTETGQQYSTSGFSQSPTGTRRSNPRPTPRGTVDRAQAADPGDHHNSLPPVVGDNRGWWGR